ncbi:glycosyltransferase family 2 protein [Streptomyces griseorubiginosus]|uniref:glycosyltransferase family 2 protein n=1 Tax=Streptomyces griseorubiginosus TaxID=67304 RepID=UPI002E8154D6|nr:glycosyltransferase family 2 protein [Streptomyces griseorubiginosus]WUB42909.1 glycosyltransferase family 2 protein [Streptomyces griseorubiginosus]WUB51428.1 glycosyltransferase family 2 protein [Streptomyces griseorubiginosus]
MTAAEHPVPTADIVIVNWNTGRYLGDCLRSIAETDRSRLRVTRIVVVDNASTDDSLHGLTAAGIPLDVVRNTRNRGFAAACNQGAARGSGDYVLFLNPDARLYPDTLRAVGRFLGTPAAHGFGIVGGLMVDEQGRPQISCSRFPSLRIWVGKMTGLDRLAPALFPPHHLPPSDLARSGPVDQVIGAFFLVRRPLFTELNGFDERYFLYLEDVDFALRAREAGWPSYYLRQARVQHAENVSSAQLGPWRHYLMLCSRGTYAALHWPRSRARLLTALTLSVEPAARLASAAAHGRWTELRTTVAVYGRYVRRLRTGQDGPPPSARPITDRDEDGPTASARPITDRDEDGPPVRTPAPADTTRKRGGPSHAHR